MISEGTFDLSNVVGKSSVHCNAEPPTAELLLMHIIAVNQHGIHGVVTKRRNRKSPPQAAESQTEEGAGREVSPQLVTRVTTNETLENWALRDLMRKRDERLRSCAKLKS